MAKGKKQKVAQVDNKGIDIGLYIMLALICIFLIYPPFFRGLFFEMEMFTTHLITFFLFLGFMVFLLLREQVRLVLYPLDYVLLALCLVYALSITVAVVPREAVMEFLRVFNYYLVYLMVSRLPVRENIRWVMYALIITTVGVSVTGLGSGFGTFDYPGAMSGNRIFTSLQYPNTAAAFLVAGFFLALSRVLEEKRPVVKGIFSAAAYFVFVTFIFTMSRGAWLYFPVVLLLFWTLYFRWFISALVYAAIPGALFLVTAIPIWEAVEESTSAGWLYVGIGVLAAFVLTVVFAYLVGALRRINIKPVRYGLIAVMAVLIIGVSAFGAANYEEMVEYLPEQVQARIERVDFDETGFTTRIELMDTAWAMVQDRPVLGAGGGGWEPLYHRYMERDYWSTEVHSHIFQVGVEAGLLGMIAFTGIWVALAYQLYRIWRAKSPDFYQASGIFVAAVALGGHSMIDFNLSLPAVAIFLWALLGLMTFYTHRAVTETPVAESAAAAALGTADGENAGGENKEAADNQNRKDNPNHKKANSKNKKSKKSRRDRRGEADLIPGEGPKLAMFNRIYPYVLMLVVLLMVLFTGMMFQGYREGQRAIAAMNEGRAEETVARFSRALDRDSMNYDFHFDLARAYEDIYRQSGEQEHLQGALHHAERALELNPEDADKNRYYGQLMLRIGEIEEGIEHLEKGYQARPYTESGYLEYADGLLTVGESFIEDGNRSEGEAYLEDLVAFREEFLAHNDQSDEFDSMVFRAYTLLRDYEAAYALKEAEELSREREDMLPYTAVVLDAVAQEEAYDEVYEALDEADRLEAYEELKALLDRGTEN